eukprot:7319114-Karenia_brevis.AAC.1
MHNIRAARESQMRTRAFALNDFFGALGVCMHSTFCNIGHSRQSYTEDFDAGSGAAGPEVTKSLIDMIGGCAHRTSVQHCSSGPFWGAAAQAPAVKRVTQF